MEGFVLDLGEEEEVGVEEVVLSFVKWLGWGIE